MACSWKPWLCAGIIGVACAASPAYGATAPSDPCSLLAAADVSKALGRTYRAPESSTAPRPFANTVTGTDCNYAPNGAGSSLLFRIYFDPSAADATGLHAKLKFFYSPPTPVSVGDEAYFDPHHGLHARKGNVRFFLSLGNGSSSNDQQLTQLASLVAAKL